MRTKVEAVFPPVSHEHMFLVMPSSSRMKCRLLSKKAWDTRLNKNDFQY